MFKDIKKSILGILILIAGVIMGVILVKQTQNFKNKAKEQVQKTYTVCHRTGDNISPWEEIVVESDRLQEYLNRGDIFGNCPEE